jgi:hypothetical protein
LIAIRCHEVGTHGSDFPATYPMLGTLPALVAPSWSRERIPKTGTT